MLALFSLHGNHCISVVWAILTLKDPGSQETSLPQVKHVMGSTSQGFHSYQLYVAVDSALCWLSSASAVGAARAHICYQTPDLPAHRRVLDTQESLQSQAKPLSSIQAGSALLPSTFQWVERQEMLHISICLLCGALSSPTRAGRLCLLCPLPHTPPVSCRFMRS